MSERLHVLLVEDDDVDAEAVKRCFDKFDVGLSITVATDAERALEIMRRPETEKPFIVLTDLNMPKKSGLEMLAEIRSDERLRDAPVCVLTTSSHATDVNAAHSMNVIAYLVKSELGSAYEKLATFIKSYAGVNTFATPS